MQTIDLLASPEAADAARVLDPAAMPLETGVTRLESGTLLVAARTEMGHCTGSMFEWWFRFAPDTRQYAWWHPQDHISSTWVETSPRTHVGSTHIVEERLSTPEVHTLHIHFVEPEDLFGAEAVARARENGDVSGFICARLGAGEEPPRDALGRPAMGRMCHIARDTPDGMVLRSRFWLGCDLDLSPEDRRAAVPDTLGLQLMQHAATEFKYLARFLPSAYWANNRDEIEVPSMW
jgi:hypothetical protein